MSEPPKMTDEEYILLAAARRRRERNQRRIGFVTFIAPGVLALLLTLTSKAVAPAHRELYSGPVILLSLLWLVSLPLALILAASRDSKAFGQGALLGCVLCFLVLLCTCGGVM